VVKKPPELYFASTACNLKQRGSEKEKMTFDFDLSVVATSQGAMIMLILLEKGGVVVCC